MLWGEGILECFLGSLIKFQLGRLVSEPEPIVPRHSMGKYVGIYRELSGLGPELYHPDG